MQDIRMNTHISGSDFEKVYVLQSNGSNFFGPGLTILSIISANNKLRNMLKKRSVKFSSIFLILPAVIEYSAL